MEEYHILDSINDLIFIILLYFQILEEQMLKVIIKDKIIIELNGHWITIILIKDNIQVISLTIVCNS